MGDRDRDSEELGVDLMKRLFTNMVKQQETTNLYLSQLTERLAQGRIEAHAEKGEASNMGQHGNRGWRNLEEEEGCTGEGKGCREELEHRTVFVFNNTRK
ncbi:hypothetical protein KI387_026768, partial [Taxus chinensis]